MVDYNDGAWHGWDDDVSPNGIDGRSKVEFFRDSGQRGVGHGTVEFGMLSGWGSIVVFRVVKVHREPREFWLNIYDNGALGAVHRSKSEAESWASDSMVERIKVVEAASKYSLEKEVMSLMEDGWRPIGGVTYAQDRGSLSFSGDHYAQAMVKP